MHEVDTNLPPHTPMKTMKIETKSRIDHLEALLRRVREASRFNVRTYRIRKYLRSGVAETLTADASTTQISLRAKCNSLHVATGLHGPA
jgi:hypothetical protein